MILTKKQRNFLLKQSFNKLFLCFNFFIVKKQKIHD
jgi:hypothetical protein